MEDAMPNDVLKEFLEKELVSVLSVAINADVVHGAAMHYSYSSEPMRLFFSADKTQRKFSGLTSQKSRQASVVIGVSEQTWVTCQMSGIISEVKASDLKGVKERHFGRIPSARQFENDPGTVFLVFEPQWYRLTDFNVDPPGILAQS
jgi:hypothetical protein